MLDIISPPNPSGETFIILPSLDVYKISYLLCDSSCFTSIAFSVSPDLITTLARRSLELSLVVVVTVMVASPASPLVGDTVHQSMARVLVTSAVHGSAAKNFITVEFSLDSMFATGVSSSITLSSSTPVPSSEQATNAKMANRENSNFFILNDYFIACVICLTKLANRIIDYK